MKKILKILVIDDETVVCEACRLVLCEKNHEVKVCMSGKSGLLALEKNGYDLVLLDIKLPDIDGLDILEIVKEKTPPPRIIVITGYATMSNALQAMKRGAVDCLSKPFTEDELIEAIEKAVS